MKTKNSLLAVSLIGVLWLKSTVTAEKSPLSAIDLQSEAHAIVVATVEDVRIETEAASFERAFGNSDWGIYLRLRVEAVEKGSVAGEVLEAKCFRVKTRRSVQEYLSPSGHDPIPGSGTRVRACLTKRGSSWDVVLPNGITNVDDGPVQDRVLSDAMEVAELRSLAYTYVLPLEVWLLVLLIGLPVLLGVRWLRKRRRELTSTGN